MTYQERINDLKGKQEYYEHAMEMLDGEMRLSTFVALHGTEYLDKILMPIIKAHKAEIKKDIGKTILDTKLSISYNKGQRIMEDRDRAMKEKPELRDILLENIDKMLVGNRTEQVELERQITSLTKDS